MNSLAVFSKQVERFEEKLNICEVNKNLPELVVFVSMLGENPPVLILARITQTSHCVICMTYLLDVY